MRTAIFGLGLLTLLATACEVAVESFEDADGGRTARFREGEAPPAIAFGGAPNGTGAVGGTTETRGGGGAPATGGEGGAPATGGEGGAPATGGGGGAPATGGGGGAPATGGEGGAPATGGGGGAPATGGEGGAPAIGGGGGAPAIGGGGGAPATGGGGGAPATGGSSATGGTGGGAPAVTITAYAMVEPTSCDRTLPYQVWDVKYADGAPVSTFSCQWTFSDGGTASTCAGTHTFATAGFHHGMVVVQDAATGAITAVTTPSVPVRDAILLEVEATAPACGLSFAYTTTKTGGDPGGFYFVSIQPFDYVLTPQPWGPSGTIEVSQPGTYTIEVVREEETAILLCTGFDQADVTVQACP